MGTFPFDPVSQQNLASVSLGASANPANVISGDPQAQELVLHEDSTTEVGVWEITAGSFHSSKIGISEFMYFIGGAGTITRESGEVVTYGPGTYVSLPDGSRVVWDVKETSRKLYVITQSPS